MTDIDKKIMEIGALINAYDDIVTHAESEIKNLEKSLHILFKEKTKAERLEKGK